MINVSLPRSFITPFVQIHVLHRQSSQKREQQDAQNSGHLDGRVIAAGRGTC